MASGSNSLSLSVPLALSASRSATIHAEELQLEGDPIVPVLPSSTRRWILLSLFTTANFLDVWCGSAAFVALAQMGEDLDMSLSELTWIPNSYALCLAAFLLTAGRISDIYSPKLVFIAGFGILGVLSLALPFSPNKECLLVIRAFTGIGASLSIPSALALIVHLFPDPKEQSFAISIFAASGGIANLSGLILGGVILLESWHWIYWIIALLAIPLSILGVFIIPSPKSIKTTLPLSRLPRMDYLGTFLQTASIVLFVFGLTNSNTVGWAKAETLAPLVLGLLFFPVFLYWQGKIDPIDALVSPSIFKIRNVLLLAIIMTTPGFYWTIIQVFYSNLMQDSWGYTPIGVALRFLPLGVVGGFVTLFIGHLPFKYFPLRYRLAAGAILGAASSVLLSFAYDSSTYYSHLLPAFMFGTAGMSMMFVSSQVAMLSSVPPKHAGVTGGVLNTASQLGQASFLALATTLQVSFPSAEDPEGTASRRGWLAAFLFTAGILVAAAILVLVFFRDPTLELDLATPSTREEDEDEEVDQKTLGTFRTLKVGDGPEDPSGKKKAMGAAGGGGGEEEDEICILNELPSQRS